MNPKERFFYIGAIAVLLLLLALVKACDKPSLCTKVHCEGQVTAATIIIKRDTVEVEKPDSSNWHKPTLVNTSLKAQEGIEIINSDRLDSNALESPKNSNRDSLALVDYWKVRAYSDTNHVEGGDVIVQNQVYMNRLALQRIIANVKQKTITEERVVTSTIKEVPKGQLFVGLIGQGQKSDPLSAFGGQILWKTKKDKIWTASVLYGKGGQVIYQAGHLFKISFK
jgi:hypothetical protein